MTQVETYDLRGWMAIAGYLGVDPQTARKWSRICGLPVWQAHPKGVVRSSKAALDDWAVTRQVARKPERKPE